MTVGPLEMLGLYVGEMGEVGEVGDSFQELSGVP